MALPVASLPQTHQLDCLGRELKCPICLSLFKHAASLSCNHTFCKSCILLSMKRNTACPVCKVPTTRREVRSAPQMDSLVAIYVNMESAAGVNLLASQSAVGDIPSANVDNVTSTQKHGSKNRKALSNITNDKKTSLGKSRKVLNSPKSPEELYKGSIPAKKRVHVPRFSSLSSELSSHNHGAQLVSNVQRLEKSSCSKGDTGDATQKTSKKKKRKENAFCDTLVLPPVQSSRRKSKKVELASTPLACNTHVIQTNVESENSDKAATNDTGKLKLDPFFWLRDEVSEDVDCTGTIQVTQLTQTNPSSQPNFSDLKDDADHFAEEPGEEVSKGGAVEADSYDSDAFEWTQQPCSPELKSSPIKKQMPLKVIAINLPMEGAVDEWMPSQKEHLSENPCQAKSCGTQFKACAQNVASTAKNAPKQVDEEMHFTEDIPKRRKTGRLRTCVSVKKANVNVNAEGVKGERRQKSLGHCSRIEALPQSTQVNASNSTDSACKGAKKTGLKRKALHNIRPPKRRDSTVDASSEVLKISQRSGIALKCSELLCAFCRTSGDSRVGGPMMHYKSGIPVVEWEPETKLIHVHKLCAEWAPDVYFTDDIAKNLEAEVGRGQKMKCSSCGLKGAVLGCCLKRCRRTYHYPCARALSCKWENDKFIMLCPEHATEKFPSKAKAPKPIHSSGCERRAHADSYSQKATDGQVTARWPLGRASKWVLSGSALDSAGKEQLVAFASLTGATLTKTWTSSVTHVIAATDEHGAARRTLKFLMAILEGKWILKSDWMAACTLAGKAVSEEPFEISFDIHGVTGGPKRGRLHAAAKAPRLFETFQFYLMGEFVASYKADLQALVAAAGGGILHRKPVMSMDGAKQSRTIIVYSGDAPPNDSRAVDRREADAIVLGKFVGAHVVPHSWILDSIAACEVQSLE